MVLGVLVCAITGDCCDAGAIHLRYRIGKAVGYYVIGSAGMGGNKKEKKKKLARGYRAGRIE
jgi:hypothetical protein